MSAADPPFEPDAEPTGTTRWSFWASLLDPDGYLLLLLLTLVQLAIWILVLDRNILIHIAAYWILLATMIVAIHRARVHPLLFRGAVIGLTFFGTAGTILAFVSRQRTDEQNEVFIGIMAVVYALMLLLAFPLIVRRAFAHRIVNINTICAALTAYLFIGLFFSCLVRIVGAFGSTFYAQDVTNNSANAVYFAFETLTTLGMGDLTPAPGVARMIAILCALAGQLYLVTAVARTVSLFGQERQGRLVD